MTSWFREGQLTPAAVAPSSPHRSLDQQRSDCRRLVRHTVYAVRGSSLTEHPRWSGSFPYTFLHSCSSSARPDDGLHTTYTSRRLSSWRDHTATALAAGLGKTPHDTYVLATLHAFHTVCESHCCCCCCCCGGNEVGDGRSKSNDVEVKRRELELRHTDHASLAGSLLPLPGMPPHTP